jgi:hypothetical protein
MLAREGEHVHRVELTTARWEGRILTTKIFTDRYDVCVFFLWRRYFGGKRYKSLGVQRILVLVSKGKNDTFAGNAKRRRPRVLVKSGSEPNPSFLFLFLDQIR